MFVRTFSTKETMSSIYFWSYLKHQYYSRKDFSSQLNFKKLCNKNHTFRLQAQFPINCLIFYARELCALVAQSISSNKYITTKFQSLLSIFIIKIFYNQEYWNKSGLLLFSLKIIEDFAQQSNFLGNQLVS